MNRDLNEAVETFWREYCVGTGLGSPAPSFVFSFGDSPALADQLAALVLQGTKRATAGALFSYSGEGGPPPRPGDLSVVVDGAGNPHCIIRTTEIRIGPLNTVDEAFARDEGEGDRSLGFWLAMHGKFFGQRARTAGIPMHDGIETVFERFIVVWPLEFADTVTPD